MPKCFKCGTEFEGKFCPECGTQWQAEKTCPQCGATLAGATKFCNHCGYAFVAQQQPQPKAESAFMRILRKIGAGLKKFGAWIKAHIKIVAPVTAAAVVVIVMLSLIPTFILASVNGTYYLRGWDGEYVQEDYLRLSTGKWTSGNESGTYSLKNGVITFKMDLGELGELLGDAELKGEVKNGVIRIITEYGYSSAYCKLSHKHKYGAWETTLEPTCTTEGARRHECFCGEVATETLLAGHTIDSDFVCSVCGMEFTKGLEYALSSSKKYYTVSGIGMASGDICIPDSYNGKPVTSIADRAFYNCSRLTSITIPNSVTSIGSSAFYNCSRLTSITIPTSVTSIGSSAFYGCSSLTSITIPNSVTSIGSGAFYGCGGLTSITVSEGNPVYHSAGNCLIATRSKSLIHGCNNSVIPSDGSVTSILDSAFYGCSSLTSITIPNSVTSIGSSAFYGCSRLTSITIPDSVTSIGSSAFYNCSSLTSITIPESVTSIGSDAFYWCSSLTSITIPNSVTSIGDSAFYGCSNLTSITIPNSVTSIGDSPFYECRRLTSIIFNGTMAEWKEITGYIGVSYTLANFAIECTDGTLDQYGNRV